MGQPGVAAGSSRSGGGGVGGGEGGWGGVERVRLLRACVFWPGLSGGTPAGPADPDPLPGGTGAGCQRITRVGPGPVPILRPGGWGRPSPLGLLIPARRQCPAVRFPNHRHARIALRTGNRVATGNSRRRQPKRADTGRLLAGGWRLSQLRGRMPEHVQLRT